MGVGAGLYMYDVVVKKFTFAISSPDEFLLPFIFAVLLLTYNFKCSFSPVKREIFLNFEDAMWFRVDVSVILPNFGIIP